MTELPQIISSSFLQLYILVLDHLESIAYYRDTPLVMVLLLASILILGIFLTVITLATVLQRAYNNRVGTMMGKLGDAFDLMMKGRSTDEIDEDHIRTVLCPKHYIYFERYLRNNVSTTGELDTAGLRRIAQVSGFSDYIRKRVRGRRKWSRALALRTLTYLRDPDDTPLYLEMLNRTRFAPVAYAAALGLALTRAYDSLDAIIRKTFHPENPNRDTIFSVLEAYGPGVCPTVAGLLSKPEYCGTVRTILLDFLRVQEYKPAAPAVEELLQTDITDEVRIHAIETLGAVGSAGSAGHLIPPLSAESFIVRLKALVALSQLDSARALPILKDAMLDSDWWVRRNAAEALLHHADGGTGILEEIAREEETPGGRTARMVLAENLQSRNRMRYRFA